MISPDPRTQGHRMEEFKWSVGRIPKELEGKVVSLARLKVSFPQTDKFWRVAPSEEHDHYNVYARSHKEDRSKKLSVAYECKTCEQIVIGPPIVESKEPVGGYIKNLKETRKIYCTNPECMVDLERPCLIEGDKESINRHPDFYKRMGL